MFRLFLVICLALGVSACDKTSSDGGDKKGDEAADKKGGDDKPAEKKKPAGITLEKVSDPGWGYEIMIPKGHKVLQKGEFGHTYSYVLPDGMFEFNIHLTPAGHENLESLVRNATMMGQKTVTEKKAVEGGFKVVKAAQGPLQEIWVAKKGATAKVTAKCSGPAKQLAQLTEICDSLKATK